MNLTPNDLISVCCVCGLVRTYTDAQAQENYHVPAPGEMDGKTPSHGYCPRCAAKERLKIKIELNNLGLGGLPETREGEAMHTGDTRAVNGDKR